MISFFGSHTGIHPKHKIMNYHQFFLNNVRAGDTVLDIGSGKGEVAYDVAAKAGSVLGIDFSRESVDQARQQFQRDNLQFIEGDATIYPFEQTFDIVILSNVLEHIADRIALLQRLKKYAPRMLIRVPMLTRDWIVPYKKQEGFEWRLDDTHEIEYTLEEFSQEIERAGLRVISHHVDWGELYAVVERP